MELGKLLKVDNNSKVFVKYELNERSMDRSTRGSVDGWNPESLESGRIPEGGKNMIGGQGTERSMIGQEAD